MEVFPVDLPPKHLRLSEPTKTAKALLRILTLKGFLGTPKLTACPLKTGLPKRKVVFQPSIFRGDVSFGEGSYLSSPHFYIWLSWPNFFSSKQFYGDSNLQSSLVLKKLAMQMPFSLFEHGVKIRVESEVVEKLGHEKKTQTFHESYGVFNDGILISWFHYHFPYSWVGGLILSISNVPNLEIAGFLFPGVFPNSLRCSSCPEFTTSPQGSDAVTHCTCPLAKRWGRQQKDV